MKLLLIICLLALTPLFTLAQIKPQPLKAFADGWKGHYQLDLSDTAKQYEFDEDHDAPVTLIDVANRTFAIALYKGKKVYIDEFKSLQDAKATFAWLDKMEAYHDAVDYKKNLKLYGPKVAAAYRNRKIAIGMPLNMVLLVKGFPDLVHTTETAAGVAGTLSYGTQLLSFKNGRLVQIDQ